MALPAEGRSASTGMTRLWCDSGDILCYPVMFRDIADMSVF
jgi:hypothetical protein